MKVQVSRQPMRILEPDGKLPYRMMVLSQDKQIVLVQHCTAWKFESNTMIPGLQDWAKPGAHLLVIASARWMIFDQDGSFAKMEKGGAN